MKKYMINNLFGTGINIAWYGIIIAIGIVIGIILATRESRRQGLSENLIYDFIFFSLPIAIIGARLYYVIFEWKEYLNNPITIFTTWEGGLAIYGGIIGGFISAVIFSKANKFPLLRLIDILVPSLALGQAIGRWGNFINQEAFGNLITDNHLKFFPYAVFIEQLNEWHQATFFYESLLDFVIFIFLVRYRKKKKFDGQLMAIYFIGYGLSRFVIEGLRADSLYLLPGLKISQVISIVLVVTGVILIKFHRKFFKNAFHYTGKYSVCN